jgi:two-component system, NtrC family, nitrogen regulation sensor histidine kinase NtrY
MGFENFRLNVIARVVILAALCFVSVWSWVNTTWLVTPLVMGMLMLLSAVELIRYVEQTSRELTSFLSFVAYHDFSTPVANPKKGPVFAQLRAAYRVLSTEFRRLNVQKAANHQYLEAVIEHVGVALVCLDDEGNVKMMNAPARRLFDVPHLNSLRTFSRIDTRLPDLLQGLGDGERALLNVQRGDETLQLVLYGKRFELLEQRYKLVSFQNIRNELSQQEIDSWQKLIRVLTHEIMNSVTPVISLSRLMRETMIDDRDGSPAFRTLTQQEQDDMLRSVTAIHTRSSGLLDFVQAYRSFAKLPTPEFSDVHVVSLLERVRTLMAREIEAARITLVLHCDDEKLSIRADARQAEQVLINLIRNAVEALADRPAPRIELRGLADEESRVLLQVIDNGPGIPPEHLEDIFIPFFTTKRNGTGVGLSISRQIMQANHGLISVRASPGEGCVFTLKFQ